MPEINNISLENCKLINCHVDNYGVTRSLHDYMNITDHNINNKVSVQDFQELQYELKRRDKIINALVGILIQKEILHENSINDYLDSLTTMNKLSEENK